ncbi:MAG TPA: Ig-like domain-containing protein, partial [Verrucomicrobiae bacterium]
MEANIDNGFSPFALGNVAQIPSAIAIITPTTNLSGVGASAQLTVIASYPDASTKNVTVGTNGTSYTVSSTNIATISANGLVTARASGTVVISALNDGAIGMISLRVQLSGDSDGDGIPDDLEVASGLNPNNPVDAEEDPDGDGLTNFQELMVYGTNVRLRDTDGDGLSDGEEISGSRGFVTSAIAADTDGDGIRDLLEIQTGSNPTNSTSFNLAQALQSFEVTPPSFVLTVNTIIGEASRQLSVIGHLKDGTTIDLASTARRTVYSSDNLFVANFGSPDGRVFAGTNGTATITVSNSTFVATVSVTVRTSTPQTLGFVAIPGFANNVDVSGNYAYVAAGSAGLQIVDISDRNNPIVVASLDTPGNADDVKVLGDFAYLADGPAGLRIISVANPLVPVFVGTVDTPGDAQDVVANGSYVYVADGSSGVQIIDVSTPSAPAIVGTIGTLSTAKGVDVRGNLAVIANGTGGILTVDVTDPTQPNVLDTLSYGGDARDVVIQNNFAFVADISRSLTSVEITAPSQPVIRASTPTSTGGTLRDVVIAGRFAFGADTLFGNRVPIIDVAFPAAPIPRAVLNFPNLQNERPTGLAVDSSYVYVTSEAETITENGIVGNTRLYIAQYLAADDTRGIPPLVTILSPLDAATV